MDQQRTDGVGILGVGVVALGVVALAMAACSSTPPPRPLPEPKAQRDTPQRDAPAQPERTDTPARAAQADEPATEPATSTTTGEPAWFRDGVFEIGGREHRAFAVTAQDVRDARGRAMAMAYERYPRGRVAAHEAVRQGDGRWRFYVLMAEGG